MKILGFRQNQFANGVPHELRFCLFRSICRFVLTCKPSSQSPLLKKFCFEGEPVVIVSKHKNLATHVMST
jgi:hypothetical protein